MALLVALCWVSLGGASLAESGPETKVEGPSCRAGGGPGGPGIERLLERNADRLHLDDATREQIRALAQDGHERTQPQYDALHRLHDEMHALLSADAPEANAVMAKADEIGRAETQLQKDRLSTMLAIRALLTSEQRRELVKIHEEFRAQHPGWNERGHGMHGPGCWRDRGERE
jgi:Spy/CpxP family protein refolding chaperone